MSEKQNGHLPKKQCEGFLKGAFKNIQVDVWHSNNACNIDLKSGLLPCPVGKDEECCTVDEEDMLETRGLRSPSSGTAVAAGSFSSVAILYLLLCRSGQMNFQHCRFQPHAQPVNADHAGLSLCTLCYYRHIVLFENVTS